MAGTERGLGARVVKRRTQKGAGETVADSDRKKASPLMARDGACSSEAGCEGKGGERAPTERGMPRAWAIVYNRAAPEEFAS